MGCGAGACMSTAACAGCPTCPGACYKPQPFTRELLLITSPCQPPWLTWFISTGYLICPLQAGQLCQVTHWWGEHRPRRSGGTAGGPELGPSTSAS